MTDVVCSEFDQKVRESKLEADEALLKIPDILRMINNAEQMTQEAMDSLEGAERDAIAAKELAEAAKNIAENADRVSLIILKRNLKIIAHLVNICYKYNLSNVEWTQLLTISDADDMTTNLLQKPAY